MGLFVDVYVTGMAAGALGDIVRSWPVVGETVNMLVDTGAIYNVIPDALAARLCLPVMREQTVELAGGMRVTRPLVPIWVRVAGRDAPSVALLWGGQPVLGTIALEASV